MINSYMTLSYDILLKMIYLWRNMVFVLSYDIFPFRENMILISVPIHTKSEYHLRSRYHDEGIPVP